MATVKSSSSDLIEVVTLKTKKRTPEAVYQGVCAVMNWNEGKAVTEEEYDKAVAAFLNRPIGGGK